jgi:hypothetical protein
VTVTVTVTDCDSSHSSDSSDSSDNSDGE